MPIWTIVSNNVVENRERRETHSHFYCLFLSLWLNPSPSAVNPIFSVHKKANPNSHFTLSQPFLVDWCKWGFFAVFKTNVSLFRVISFNAFWKFLWLRNSTWDFLGVNCVSGIFLGFVGSPGDFFGFWFLPSFDHPCHLKSEVPFLGSWEETYSRWSLLPAFLCAHIFIERERRLGTRQSHLHVLHIMSLCPIAYISMPCIFKSPCLKSLFTYPNVPIHVLVLLLGKAMTLTCSFISNRTLTQMLKQSFHSCLNLCRRVLKKTRKERKHHLQ